MKCRHCRRCSMPCDVFVDLGAAPPSNAFLPPKHLARPSSVPAAGDDLSASASWCRSTRCSDATRCSPRLRLLLLVLQLLAGARRALCRAGQRAARPRPRILVIEVASNDGYLLQYVAARGIPCVGIEPTAGTAEAARAKGIETIGEFFGAAFARSFAAERGRADLMLGNNVLAHVPDINDFVAGLASAGAGGTVTVEFPHLLQLISRRSSTRSTTSTSRICRCTRCSASSRRRAGGVGRRELPTHGGSLRVWAQHAAKPRRSRRAVAALLAEEDAAGMREPRLLPRPPGAGRHDQARTACLPDRAEARRPDGRRLRRRRQGQYPAQLRRRAARPAAVRGRCVAAQAGPLPAGLAHSGARRRAAARSTGRTSC